ncbi:condensation protein [Streptomyces diacarni]|uniref:condensation protein n=1 Tax=Streptomyces diacarni TaxID=2800381 RepID=UPI0033D0471F
MTAPHTGADGAPGAHAPDSVSAPASRAAGEHPGSALVSGGGAGLPSARLPHPPAPGERRIPFPTVDEITRHCLDDDEPETVHVEIHLPAVPDPDRLRQAFREAMRRHPRILMRQSPSRWWRSRYTWVLTGEPDRDPVAFPGGTLQEARRRALAQCPPLDASPPFRAEVIENLQDAEDGGGCVLLVTINHTALDGPACLRVIATAAHLYGGADNAPAPPPVRAPLTPGHAGAGTEAPARSWTRPARVAAHTRHPDAPGNGMLIADLPVPARPPRAAGEDGPYTVNDQLLVATWLMVARWNSAHAAPVRPVRVTMPVDDRPRTADMPIGNGTRLVEVGFGPEERALYASLAAPGAADRGAVEQLLRATAVRTRALKSADRPQLGFSSGLLTTPLLPVGLRAAGTRALRGAAAPWASSVLLSNIGRVPYPLDFGDAGRARAVWFSAPAKRPRGLSVTTVSTGGRLQLALRWSHARLDDEAGRRLGELFTGALAETAHVADEPS